MGDPSSATAGPRFLDGSASGFDLTRRRLLGMQALLLAGAGSGGAGIAGATTPAEDSFSATVELDLGDRNETDVPETIFGRFAEHYGDHEAYPGLYAEHVTNTSFVEWCQFQGSVSHVYGFDEVGEYGGVPFPWEPITGNSDGSVDHQQPSVGGVRGYEEWTLDENGYPVEDLESGNAYQRVTLDDAEGGVRQRIVLPDWRTLGYEFAVSVRSEGVDELEVRLSAPDGTVLASETLVDLPDEWERYEDVELELSEESGSTLQGGSNDDFASPYGEYVLELVAEGEGAVDLDWVSLVPDDAIEGERTGAPFNRTSIELMRDRNSSLLKWPGGNYTSTYRWEDGIGPDEDRPVWPNIVWDGVDENLMGTAEYVDFCELAGAEPTITVGVTVPPEWEGGEGREFQPPEPITPEGAANWVEYCNGDPEETEYGALRAEHGYEEPFDVEVWEVGNEVWGPWQAGGTDDPEAFAEHAAAFVDAMTAVDDSITVIPDGMDPKYDDPDLAPDPDDWNEALFDLVGDDADGIGMHRYNWGIEDLEMLADWKADNDADALDYNEVLLTFPTQFEELLAETAGTAADFGMTDFQIMIGEWGLFPTVEPGDPWPGMPTMAGASYVAGMYNTFIRRSDIVRRACHTHIPVRMFPPESVPIRRIRTRCFRSATPSICTRQSSMARVSGPQLRQPSTARPGTFPRRAIESVRWTMFRTSTPRRWPRKTRTHSVRS
ncbi:alpha-L-arabinofuranosidase [Natrialbaceae archaeon A-arb3/5]